MNQNKNIPCHAGGNKHEFSPILREQKGKKMKVCLNCPFTKEAGILDKVKSQGSI